MADCDRALAETAALLKATRVVVDEREFVPAARAVFELCRDLIGATAGYVALLSEGGDTNDVLVERPMSLSRKLLQKSQIRVELEVPTDLPLVTCRSNQIAQVLMNLLTNARDALNARYPGAHPDKVVRVTARTTEHEGRASVRIMVEDHGVGVPEAVRERIFDPFYTTKPRDQGTGLGLSLSLGFVHEHGGRLWVEPVPTGGSRFFVELPCRGNRQSTVGA